MALDYFNQLYQCINMPYQDFFKDRFDTYYMIRLVKGKYVISAVHGSICEDFKLSIQVSSDGIRNFEINYSGCTKISSLKPCLYSSIYNWVHKLNRSSDF
jgi:hypothetical protein